MKRFLLGALLVFGLISASSNNTYGQTCLDAYKKVFKERGADLVADGMHRSVIIALEEEGETVCLLGKARVEGLKVTAVFIQFEDDSYELFEGQDFKVPYGVNVKNGVSEPWETKTNQKISVIFKDSIKPKKKKYKQAPKIDPNSL